MENPEIRSSLRKCREVRDLALQRLLERRSPEGCWRTFFDSSAFVNASFIIMLRTTGLVEKPGAFEKEAGLVAHLIRQVNPDGGFYKYRGSPSSPNITRVALLALEMAGGRLPVRRRPATWLRANPAIQQTLHRDMRFTRERAERFLRREKWGRLWAPDREFALPARMLKAYATEKGILFPPVLISPALLFWAARWQAGAAVLSQFNTMIRKMLPAFSILSQRILKDHPLGLLILNFKGKRYRRSLQEMAGFLLSQQNGCGGWFYNIPYTIANIMASIEAGIPADHPAISKAMDYLEENLRPDGSGGLKLNIMNSDIWDTGLAVSAYLEIPGRSSSGGEIRDGVEFLIDSQHADGSYAWASNSHNDADNDSTAHAVRALAVALRSADPSLRKRIKEALRRGTGYLLSHQARGGGFSVWRSTFARSKPGSLSLWRQFLFDSPSADVTARVLSALGESGFSAEDAPARAALRFIIRHQSPNGGWWCRWWAGYVSGTCYVLEALGKLGFRLDGGPPADGFMRSRLHGSLVKGVGFLLRHQNRDGGWGETVKADSSIRYAGVGESRPLQTSFVVSSLLACGFSADAPEIKRALEYLLFTATADGRWEDDQVTFSLFSRNLYYHYPLMNSILPLNALSAFLKAAEGNERKAVPGQAQNAEMASFR